MILNHSTLSFVGFFSTSLSPIENIYMSRTILLASETLIYFIEKSRSLRSSHFTSAEGYLDSRKLTLNSKMSETEKNYFQP